MKINELVVQNLIITIENSLKCNQYVVDDLLSIGKNKSVGYLPLGTITNKEFGGYNEIIKDIISWSDYKNYNHILYSMSECSIFSGALYIYDQITLSSILFTYKDILENAGIPITPNEYITYINKNIVYNHLFPEAYKVIGLTFADKRFL